jgi:hypothetical protein
MRWRGIWLEGRGRRRVRRKLKEITIGLSHDRSSKAIQIQIIIHSLSLSTLPKKPNHLNLPIRPITTKTPPYSTTIPQNL